MNAVINAILPASVRGRKFLAWSISTFNSDNSSSNAIEKNSCEGFFSPGDISI